MNKALLIFVLVVFGALTGYTLLHYGGLLAWLAFYTRDPASWQIYADLVIAMCLLLVFIRRDAQANGRPFVPWAVDFGNQCPYPDFENADKRYVTQVTDAVRSSLRPYKWPVQIGAVVLVAGAALLLISRRQRKARKG